MPSSPGTSIERVWPSVDPKIHAGGPAPAVSIAADIRLRKARLEVINAPSVKRTTSRAFAARSEGRLIYFECYTDPEKERSQNRAGAAQAITSLRTCRPGRTAAAYTSVPW